MAEICGKCRGAGWLRDPFVMTCTCGFGQLLFEEMTRRGIVGNVQNIGGIRFAVFGGAPAVVPKSMQGPPLHDVPAGSFRVSMEGGQPSVPQLFPIVSELAAQARQAQNERRFVGEARKASVTKKNSGTKGNRLGGVS